MLASFRAKSACLCRPLRIHVPLKNIVQLAVPALAAASEERNSFVMKTQRDVFLGPRHVLPVGYDLIMVRSILNGVTACRACGTCAGMMIISPC